MDRSGGTLFHPQRTLYVCLYNPICSSLINEEYTFGPNKIYLSTPVFCISFLGNETFVLLYEASEGTDVLRAAEGRTVSTTQTWETE